MKFGARFLCLAAMAVIATTNAARADMLVGDFNMDGNQNAVASVGQITMSLNGNGTINVSVTETASTGIAAVGINSSSFILGSAFSYANAVNTMVFASTGLYMSGMGNSDFVTHDTFQESWTLGAPGDFTSVLQALGGTALTSFVLELRDPNGGAAIAYTAQAALVTSPTPTVPEPSSFALLGLGAIGFVIRALRRNMLLA